MAMSGDDDREHLSLEGLPARMDSLEERFGTMENSLQDLRQAVEGIALQLNRGTNRADGLHLGGSRIGRPRQPPPHQPPPHQPPPPPQRYHQQPHHRRQQIDYYDDYSPPRQVHHLSSIQSQPRQQQRGSASVAMYCAKKLPPTTALIAFHQGQVIFERGSINLHSGEESKTNLRSILHPNVGTDAKAIVPSCKAKRAAAELSRPSSYGLVDGDSEDGSSDRRLVVHDSSSISLLVRKLPEPRPGWPLLKRAVTANIEALRDSEARKISVVQWVMNLPDRSLFQSATRDLIKELEIILHNNSSTCKWFRYEELQFSTNYFSTDYLIGKGGSSQVYKGCLPNGEKVAIKLSRMSKKTSRDFLLEADIITKLQHERIVPLLGICVECSAFLSVYGYFSKGSLEENLHGSGAKHPIPWDKRFKIAGGVAEALSYLHNGCSRPVVHRDVKSSNILLNDDFEPQLSDFGLAIWAPTNSLFQTHSDVVGTFGYLAPEYFMYGRVSNKIDVYAYGVVLLELLTGRKPICDENPKGQKSLGSVFKRDDQRLQQLREKDAREKDPNFIS